MNAMNEPRGFVDFHTHLLPQMDDGAKDVRESERMLDLLRGQGVATVFLTPHFYPYRESLYAFVERRSRSFSRIRAYARQAGVNLALASETYLQDYLFNYGDLSELCLQGKDGRLYLLTELPFDTGVSKGTAGRLSRLIGTCGVVPVLAHIERYPGLFRAPALIDRLIGLGCLMQVNLGSLSHGYFRRKRILRYLRDGKVHVVGTDAHNTDSRAPRYSGGMAVIERKLGREFCIRLTRDAEEMGSGRLFRADQKEGSHDVDAP